MSVSIRLRTDTSTMYEYTEGPNPLDAQCFPKNIEIQLDTLPIIHPYVPRLCNQQGHFLIWYGTSYTDSDLSKVVCKGEEQWVNCSKDWMIEKGVCLVYPFEDEVILGLIKTAGYMIIRNRTSIRNFIQIMWTDIIKMFGNKKIICPTGSYLEFVQMSMNQSKISHDPYHKRIMKQFNFVRDDYYWIREPNGA